MNIKPLECFISVIRHGNLKDAANEMNMTEAAISKCIAGLSKDIGVPLFVRHKKLILTEAGQRYADAAYQIINIKRQTYEMLLSVNQFEPEHISLGLSPHMGASIFSYVYNIFHTKHPYVKIDTYERDFNENIRMLKSGERDLVIGLDDANYTSDGSTKFLPASQSEWLIAIVDTHPLAGEGALSGECPLPKIELARLKDIPFISMSDRTYSHTLQTRLARQSGFEPLTVYTTSDVGLLRNMARIMCGYCFLPKAWCISGVGLRYYSSDPACVVTSGFYVRDNFSISDSIAYFLYLCTIKILDNEYQNIDSCPSETLCKYIEKFGD